MMRESPPRGCNDETENGEGVGSRSRKCRRKTSILL